MPGSKDLLASRTLAELYYKQGDLKKAIEVLKQTLENQPANMDARQELCKWEKQLFQSVADEERKKSLGRLERILEAIRKEREK